MARPPLVVMAALALAIAAPALANPQSVALRNQASDELYNLDRESAMATFRRAVAADPTDAGAYRGLASALWLSVTFRRGNMTVDDYLGKVARPNAKMTPPPAETAAAFRDAIDKALALARAQITANEKNADAHY